MTRVVLLNLAHKGRSPSADAAAFRLLGVFNSFAEAKAHAARVPGDVSAHGAPLGQWLVVTERGEDDAAALERIQSRYKARLKENEDAFQENVAQRRTGVTTARGDDAAVDASRRGEDDGRAAPDLVPRDAEVRDQSFAVVSFVLDGSDLALVVWDVYGDEAKAREAARGRFAGLHRNYHMDVVVMYEWITPADLDPGAVEEEHRDPQLTELMKHRKNERHRVEEFRAACADGGRPVPVLDLGAPGDLEPGAVPYPEILDAAAGMES